MNKYHSNKCILKARLTFTSCVESVVYDLFLLLALLAFLKMSRTFILYICLIMSVMKYTQNTFSEVKLMYRLF